MQARVHQRPGATWTVEIEVPAFTEKQMAEIFEEGVRIATEDFIKEQIAQVVKEIACVKVKTAASILDIASVETVRGYGKKAPKDPKYLPILPGESAWGDKVNLFDLKDWVDRLKRHDAREKIAAYEAKHAKH